MARSAAALLGRGDGGQGPGGGRRGASLNHFTAWRRLDEMLAYTAAR
jgi:hypothetical protein